MFVCTLVFLFALLVVGVGAGSVANFVRCEGPGIGADFSYSPDGLSWSFATPPQVLTDAAMDSGCRDVCYSPDLNVWVATGKRGDLKPFAGSTDGVVWTLSPDDTTLSGNEGRACAWGRDKFVVGGGIGTVKNAHSFDGVSWAPGNPVGLDIFHGLAYSNQQQLWVGVGEADGVGKYVLSGDGITWGTVLDLVATSYVADVAWSNFDGVWAFVAKGSASGNIEFHFANEVPIPGFVMRAGAPLVSEIPSEQSLVGLEGGGFLALVGSTNQVWSSTKGAVWSPKSTLGPQSNSSRGICAWQSTVVAMGFNTAVQTPHDVYTSVDGAATFRSPTTSATRVNSNVGAVANRVTNVAGASFVNGSFLVPFQSSATISSPFAFVAESLTVLGNVTFASNAFVTISQTLTCGLSSTLALVVAGPGAFQLASFRSISGTFGSVEASDASGNCYEAVPAYSASSLSVTVSLCGNGPSPGARIGIIVGAVVGGVVLAISVVVVTVVLRNNYVAHANKRIRMESMENARNSTPYRKF